MLLAPYDSTVAFSGRIRVAVPRMGVGENAATGLALVIHELATNSFKYGSLSTPEGTLDISGTVVGEEVEIGWSEQGGPEVSPPPTQWATAVNLSGERCRALSEDRSPMRGRQAGLR
ncbi:MAG: hypothetical protein ACK4QP_02610 [Pseudorhizobium sp.]